MGHTEQRAAVPGPDAAPAVWSWQRAPAPAGSAHHPGPALAVNNVGTSHTPETSGDLVGFWLRARRCRLRVGSARRGPLLPKLPVLLRSEKPESWHPPAVPCMAFSSVFL